MIKLENVGVSGWEAAIRGMRNPMNSWDKSDTEFIDDPGSGHNILGENIACIYEGHFPGRLCVGEADLALMNRLAFAGSADAKYRRMIVVTLDITAPLYWWKEFDTYKVGTVANSCSTMHKIHAKEFTLDDFSHEHLAHESVEAMETVIECMNFYRQRFLDTKDKTYWWQMIQLLPSSYNQRRTVMLSYEVLSNIYFNRKNHKLDEWRDFCAWIKSLPYSELITLESKGAE